jgi:hypothetical protein
MTLEFLLFLATVSDESELEASLDYSAPVKPGTGIARKRGFFTLFNERTGAKKFSTI